MAWSFWYNLGFAHFMSDRFEQSAACAQRSTEIGGHPGIYRLLAAALGHAGRLEEGRRALARLHELTPEHSVDALVYFPPAVLDRLLEGWRRLGWPG